MKHLTPKFIWIDDSYKIDSYVEFFSTFSSNVTEANIDIAVDSDYELYINDTFINCGTFPSYPGKANIDTLKVKLNSGENRIRVIVYYNGASTFSTYYKKDPFLYFKVYDCDTTFAVSDENVLSRYSSEYESFHEKRITYQLGYKVYFNFLPCNDEYKQSVVLDSSLNLSNRPNKKLIFLEQVNGKLVKQNGQSFIYDLGKEIVGFLSFSIISEKEKDIVISFGEHIKEGRILDDLGGRDFTFSIHLNKGVNQRTLYLRRIGCRYLSINDQEGLTVNYLGILPVEYPFNEKQIEYKNELDKQLIDIAKYTIKCCYHEHFEDCPWREQAQYTFDMKCTLLGFYKLFDNPEVVKSAIDLIIEDPRTDGDLDITFPANFYLIIPSFTLYFMPLMLDYYHETSDKETLKKSLDKFELVVSNYINKLDNGLLKLRKSESCWIFYEWKPGFDGNGKIVPEKDFLINALFLYSLQAMKEMYKALNVEFNYNDVIVNLRKQIIKEFYDEKTNRFIFAKENPITSELMLAYAILTDLIPEKNDVFASQIVEKKVLESTNSFKSLVYESLLKVNPEYKYYIVDEIRDIYKKMIDDGATTFYETNLGYLDFEKAGSLCHGWNAFIIKYLLELM